MTTLLIHSGTPEAKAGEICYFRELATGTKQKKDFQGGADYLNKLSLEGIALLALTVGPDKTQLIFGESVALNSIARQKIVVLENAALILDAGEQIVHYATDK